MLATWGASRGFNPASLFSGGEQGAWYDPSNVNLTWRRNLAVMTTFGSLAGTAGSQYPNGTGWSNFFSTGGTRTYVASSVNAGEFAMDIAGVSSARNVIGFTFAAASSTTYTVSFWIESVSGVTGVVSYASGTLGSGGSTNNISAPSTTGRVQYTFTTGTGAGNVDVRLGIGAAGNESGSIRISGVQVEQASTASAYQQIVTPEITYVATVQPQPVMFTNANGSTPVTGIEQAVGLILDQSKNLAVGSDILSGVWLNAAPAVLFDTFTSTSSSGFAATTTGAKSPRARCVGSFTVPGWYQVNITVDALANGSITVNTSDNAYSGTAIATGSITTTGTFQFIIGVSVATTSLMLVCVATGAATFTISGVTTKLLSGNHAYQTTDASRPTLRARYNLLTYSEQFDNAYWSNIALMTVSANAGTAPDGTTTADKIIPTAVSGTHQIGRLSVVTSAAYVFSVYAKAAGYDTIEVLDGTGGVNGALFNLSTGAVTNKGTGVGSAVSVGDGWYRCTVNYTTTGIRIYVPTSSSTFTGDGTSGVLLWGAQLLTPADNTSTGNAYQRIAAATDYVTVSTMGGTVFNPYLAFDGSDDSLLTQSINFSVTNQMTVWGGVTKLSDAATAFLCELSATSTTNDGTFALFAPNTSNDFGWRSRGTATVTLVPSGYAAPITRVITGIASIPSPLATIRVNGSVASTDTSTSQGTGNYGNYPLFIGRRNNVSFPINGRIYQLIIRGAASSATQISGTEQYVAGKTGVAL